MRDEELFAVPRQQRLGSIREVGASLADGLRYVRRTDLVLLAIVVVGVVSTFGMNFGVIIPALAQEVLRVDATGYGFLMAATGVGSLIAALWIAFSPRSRVGLIWAGAIVLGVAEVAAAIFQLFPLALVAMLLVGLGAIAMAATGNTTIQLNVPDALRGRVLAVYTTVFVGSTPIGGLLIGGIASVFGVPAALAVGGAACIVTGVAALGWLRRIRARQAVTSGPAIAAAGVEPAGGHAPARPR
jgi:MFS family permease